MQGGESELMLNGFNELFNNPISRLDARNECKKYMEDYRFYTKCLRVLRKNNAHKKLIAKVTKELDIAQLYYEYFSSRC